MSYGKEVFKDFSNYFKSVGIVLKMGKEKRKTHTPIKIK